MAGREGLRGFDGGMGAVPRGGVRGFQQGYKGSMRGDVRGGWRACT